MSVDRIVVAGESYLTVERAAECFAVRTSFVLELYGRGLLGAGVHRHDALFIASDMLDRLAQIERLHRLMGADLDAIELWLEVLPRT